MTATRVLMLINIGVYFIITLFGFNNQNDIFMTFGFVSDQFLSGKLWQPLTAMFLHGGIIHILCNMIALWGLGEIIEKQIGLKRYLILYFVSGIAGFAVLPTLFQTPHISGIGSSGAILGLLGAMAFYIPDSKLLVFFFPMKVKTAAVGIAIISTVLLFVDNATNISHAGHLGGLVAGWLVTKYYLSKGNYYTGR